MKWFESIFGFPAEPKETQVEEGAVNGEIGHTGADGIFTSAEPSIFALNHVHVIGKLDSLDERDPPLDPAQTPVLTLDPPPPDPNLNNTIIEPIINLVDSIFKQDAEKDNLKYFFSIFMPLAESEDITKKSTASTPSSAPTITIALETELKEILQQCASAYFSGDNDLTLSDSSDPQSGSTKITPTSSTSKAQPPVYFGVGIKTELAEAGDEKFLKITEIFSNSNLRKEKQGNVDYTNQFITHLNCKLNDDEEAKDHSITAIFNKFKGDNQKEKFDEKIDQIFRDISRTSIKFKISADKSQSASSEVNIDKIIFEKTSDGAYKQKTTTPSTITANRKASIAAAPKGKAV